MVLEYGGMKGLRRLSLAVLTVLLFSGCAMLDPDHGSNEPVGPYEQVFFASFEQVWRAAQLALARYPMRVNNMDTGTLQTDLVGGGSAWKAPTDKKRISNAQHYAIVVNVIKGRSLSSKAVKVVIEKRVRKKTSFFSDTKELQSDGLEERVIGYRIGRILTIERAIERALKDSEAGNDEI